MKEQNGICGINMMMASTIDNDDGRRKVRPSVVALPNGASETLKRVEWV